MNIDKYNKLNWVIFYKNDTELDWHYLCNIDYKWILTILLDIKNNPLKNNFEIELRYDLLEEIRIKHGIY